MKRAQEEAAHDEGSRHRDRKTSRVDRQSTDDDRRVLLKPDFRPSGALSAKAKSTVSESEANPEKASFALSGTLAKDKKTGNVVKSQVGTGGSLVSKYSPPSDACNPAGDWRLFVFDGDDCIETLYLHRKSHFLLGRDEELTDIPLSHSSCSKEHAALQYKAAKPAGVARLYVIDLESTNGTRLNHSRVVPAHFIELKDGDVLNFGESPRDYVLKKRDA